MEKILFQGDSITDANRTRESESYLGSGYPNFVSGILAIQYPEKYKVINRGVSGNKISDLLLRLRKDIIDIAPDYLSILIGINDVWHEVDGQNGIDANLFEKVFTVLMDEVSLKLPNTKVIIMEPFVLKGWETNRDEGTWKYFYEETLKRAEVCKKIAKKYKALYIPLQKFLEEEQNKYADESYLLRDGVHPTAAGALVIANEWIKYFTSQYIK